MLLPPRDRRRRVWLGAAGTATAFGIIKTVKHLWGKEVFVVAADTNPREQVAAVAFADAFEQVPPASEPVYFDHLEQRFRAWDIGIYYPILDQEIVWAAKVKGRLAPNIVVIAPSPETALICTDKLQSYHWMVKNGIPTVMTNSVQDYHWSGSPVFAKPRFGVGSVGARVLRTEAEFAGLANQATESDRRGPPPTARCSGSPA